MPEREARIGLQQAGGPGLPLLILDYFLLILDYFLLCDCFVPGELDRWGRGRRLSPKTPHTARMHVNPGYHLWVYGARRAST